MGYKTVVSEITGRKDYPVFKTDSPRAVLERLERTDWSICAVNISSDGKTATVTEGDEISRDTFTVIDVQFIDLTKGDYYKELRNVYRMHLVNNNLEDDSKSITNEDIEDYVYNHISEEDRKWYGCPPKR